MIYTEMILQLREQVGRPSIDEVNNDRMLQHLNSALEWLAGELGYNPTTTTQALTADDYDYVLGVGVSEVLWVKHGSTPLQAASISQWVRDEVPWRSAPSGSPTQYAFEGTTLFVYPPPDTSADDTALTYSYLPAAPTIDTASATTATALLSNQNQGLLLWKAAEEYYLSTITRENAAQRQVQIAGCQQQIGNRLGNAKRQVTHGARQSGPRPNVFTRGQGVR